MDLLKTVLRVVRLLAQESKGFVCDGSVTLDLLDHEFGHGLVAIGQVQQMIERSYRPLKSSMLDDVSIHSEVYAERYGSVFVCTVGWVQVHVALKGLVIQAERERARLRIHANQCLDTRFWVN